MLGGIGPRADWPRIRHEANASKPWTRWARVVVKQRWVGAGVAIVALAVLLSPVFGLKVGQTSVSALAQTGPAHDGVRRDDRVRGSARASCTPLEVLATSDAAPAAFSATQTGRGHRDSDLADRARGVPGRVRRHHRDPQRRDGQQRDARAGAQRAGRGRGHPGRHWRCRRRASAAGLHPRRLRALPADVHDHRLGDVDPVDAGLPLLRPRPQGGHPQPGLDGRDVRAADVLLAGGSRLARRCSACRRPGRSRSGSR